MTGVELRSAPDGKLVLRGHASVFEHWYAIGNRFKEVVRPGAFRRTLGEAPDVVLLVEHEGLPLARTRSPNGGEPTLRLSEDSRGLFAEGDLDPRNPRVQELQSVAAHTGLAMSFAFQATGERWDDAKTKREIKSVNLNRGDVTASARPANPATGMTIDERSEVSYTLEEREELVEMMRGQRERRTCPEWDVPLLDERSNYSAAELAQLGAKGMAFLNSDGHWSYPTKTVDDWQKAKQAVGRSGGSHNKVRHYLIGRAKALGISHLVPDNWAPSGALRRSIEVEMQECGACEGTGVCSRCEGSGEVEAGGSRSAVDFDYEAAHVDLLQRGAKTGLRIYAPGEARSLLQEEEIRRLAARR